MKLFALLTLTILTAQLDAQLVPWAPGGRKDPVQPVGNRTQGSLLAGFLMDHGSGLTPYGLRKPHVSPGATVVRLRTSRNPCRSGWQLVTNIDRGGLGSKQDRPADRLRARPVQCERRGSEWCQQWRGADAAGRSAEGRSVVPSCPSPIHAAA